MYPISSILNLKQPPPFLKMKQYSSSCEVETNNSVHLHLNSGFGGFLFDCFPFVTIIAVVSNREQFCPPGDMWQCSGDIFGCHR